MNSRRAGHDYEREARLWWFDHGYRECTTSRYSSREKDDQKVDLCHTEPFNVQCKRTAQAPNMHKLLKEMPKDSNYNVVFHKRPNQGTTVTMSLTDFGELLNMLKENGII